MPKYSKKNVKDQYGTDTMSDLLGVHVRGEKKRFKIADPRSQENLTRNSRLSSYSHFVLEKWQWTELEMQNYEEHIKRKHVQCPDGVKKQLNIRNIVFGAPTSICGAHLQPFSFPVKIDLLHTSRTQPLLVHLHVFTCGSRAKKRSSHAKRKGCKLDYICLIIM